VLDIYGNYVNRRRAQQNYCRTTHFKYPEHVWSGKRSEITDLEVVVPGVAAEAAKCPVGVAATPAEAVQNLGAVCSRVAPR